MTESKWLARTRYVLPRLNALRRKARGQSGKFIVPFQAKKSFAVKNQIVPRRGDESILALHVVGRIPSLKDGRKRS